MYDLYKMTAYTLYLRFVCELVVYTTITNLITRSNDETDKLVVVVQYEHVVVVPQNNCRS